ncbi:MAG TPA: hypothetical protein VFV87_02950 [Pirellulaceae bacterium]|nr:hypothetical protein [Pirellulaceae bacterium]
MAEPFDPYRKWLGIPSREQPPHHYRLLGIALFEDDPDVIENAATRQMTHVRTFQTSKQHGPLSQRILTELSAAKLCLLTPESKAEYDAQLRAQFEAAGEHTAAETTAEAGEGDAGGGDAEVELPPFASSRGSEVRWRTGAAPEIAIDPSPVPIPMPQIVTAAAAAPAFPAVRSTTKMAAAARPTQKRSVLPIALIAAGLLGLVALVSVAVAIANHLGSDHARLPVHTRPASANGERNPASAFPEGKPASKSSQSSDSLGTPFPVGGSTPAGGGIATARPATPFPVPAPTPADDPPAPQAISQADRDELVDRMRQSLFRSEQSLRGRENEEFQRQFAMAEELAASKELPDSAKFQEQVDDLRVLKKLNDEFWTTVQNNLRNKLAVGEKIEFHQHKFELLARDGERVEYLLNGEQHADAIGQLEPKAAILIASKSVKWEDPVTFLPIAAFLSVDGKVTDEAERKFGKQLFAIGRLIGQANPAIARKLGLRDVNEEVKLDDLVEQIPLPLLQPEPKPE